MSSNLEKLKKVAKRQSQKDLEFAECRVRDTGWMKKSALVSLAIEQMLKEKGMSKQEFAERLGVTPPQVTKWLSGKENLCLRTISRMEEVLGEDVISVPTMRRQRFVKLDVQKSTDEDVSSLTYGAPSLAYEGTNANASWTLFDTAI